MNRPVGKLRKVYLKPGEFYFSILPSVVSTILGSCVSVTMFSPELHMGAICHAVLPEEKSSGEAFRYVDSSILTMLKGFERYGVSRTRIEVKLFGGSDVLSTGGSGKRGPTVGKQNIEAALQVLEREHLKLTASDFGGMRPRKILFKTHTGEILLKRLCENRGDT